MDRSEIAFSTVLRSNWYDCYWWLKSATIKTSSHLQPIPQWKMFHLRWWNSTQMLYLCSSGLWSTFQFQIWSVFQPYVYKQHFWMIPIHQQESCLAFWEQRFCILRNRKRQHASQDVLALLNGCQIMHFWKLKTDCPRKNLTMWLLRIDNNLMVHNESEQGQ